MACSYGFFEQHNLTISPTCRNIAVLNCGCGLFKQLFQHLLDGRLKTNEHFLRNNSQHVLNARLQYHEYWDGLLMQGYLKDTQGRDLDVFRKPDSNDPETPYLLAHHYYVDETATTPAGGGAGTPPPHVAKWEDPDYDDWPNKHGIFLEPDVPIATCFDQHRERKRPYIYIYNLPHSYRNSGYNAKCVYDEECVFSGPPREVQGVPTWENGQFDFPLMVYYRLLHSQSCTTNISDADLFFVPAFREYANYRCHKKEKLIEQLHTLNPRLQEEEYMKVQGPRHFMIDGRALEPCGYFTAIDKPLNWFHHWNLEIQDGLPFNKGRLFKFQRETGTLTQKTTRYSTFPYPATYHGTISHLPARSRPRGSAEYLWSYLGTDHGLYVTFIYFLVLRPRGCTRSLFRFLRRT